MYGEWCGTGTLAKSLRSLSKRLYLDMDDGRPWSELVDDARMLMEGSIVLWETIVSEAYEKGCEDEA